MSEPSYEQLRREFEQFRRETEDWKRGFERMEMAGAGRGGQVDRTQGNILIDPAEAVQAFLSSPQGAAMVAAAVQAAAAPSTVSPTLENPGPPGPKGSTGSPADPTAPRPPDPSSPYVPKPPGSITLQYELIPLTLCDGSEIQVLGING